MKGEAFTSSSTKFDLISLEISLVLDNFNKWLQKTTAGLHNQAKLTDNPHQTYHLYINDSVMNLY